MFAIIDLNLISQLSDRELKVYATILALSHKGNGVIRLSEIKEITGKGKTQLIETINDLIKRGLIKRLDRGKYEIRFELKYSIEFEIDFNGFNLRERKKILKIIKDNNLSKEETKKILEYIKQAKVKDKVRYFAWCVRNYHKINQEKGQIEQVKIFGVENFYKFQSYLNGKKIKYNFKLIEKPKQVNVGFVGGEWIFEGKDLQKIYQEFKLEKQKQNAYI